MTPFRSVHHSQSPAVPGSLSALCEQYRQHALTIRSVAEETLNKEFVYLHRLFEYFGSPDRAALRFAKIRPATVSAFLVQYARAYGPGSCWSMQCVFRSFLRFAYQRSHLERDLSPLVPAVRTRRMAHLPAVLPEECIRALDDGIQPDDPAGRRDAAIVCLLASYVA